MIALREYCRKQCRQIAADYVDREAGAVCQSVRSFQQMFSDGRQRKFDLLLFWSVDRLSREGVAEPAIIFGD